MQKAFSTSAFRNSNRNVKSNDKIRIKDIPKTNKNDHELVDIRPIIEGFRNKMLTHSSDNLNFSHHSNPESALTKKISEIFPGTRSRAVGAITKNSAHTKLHKYEHLLNHHFKEYVHKVMHSSNPLDLKSLIYQSFIKSHDLVYNSDKHVHTKNTDDLCCVSCSLMNNVGLHSVSIHEHPEKYKSF